MSYTWKVKYSDLPAASFEDYIADFKHMYQKSDAKRDVTDILINLIAKSSRLSESARRKMYSRVIGDLADVIAWLFSLAAKFRSELEDEERIFRIEFDIAQAVFEKYPFCCPVCLSRVVLAKGGIKSGSGVTAIRDVLTKRTLTDAEVNEVLGRVGLLPRDSELIHCTCMTSSDDPELRKEILVGEAKAFLEGNLDRIRIGYSEKSKKAFSSPQTLSDFEEMFFMIYSNNLRATSIEDIVFHLQEELGELADALKDLYTYDTRKIAEPSRKDRDERVHNLCEEFADVISWIFSLVFKTRLYVGDFKKNADFIVVTEGDAEEIRAHEEQFSKLLQEIQPNKISIHNIIWRKYGKDHTHLRCGDICQKDICECPWLIARTKDEVDKILSR